MAQPTPELSEQDLILIRSGTTEQIAVAVTDPLDPHALPAPLADGADAGRLEVIDTTNNTLQDISFADEGTPDVKRLGEGRYQIDFDATGGAGTYMLFWRFKVGREPNVRTIRKTHCIGVTGLRTFHLQPKLRIMIDKSRKALTSSRVTGRHAASYGYSDAMLAAYLELGAGIINMVPPYTNFTLESFPRMAGPETLLIYAALIVGLESQGVYSIDTDFPFSFGGNSITVDHLSKIAQFMGLPFLNNFKELVVSFKQQFRSKGSVLVQMQYSYSLGRFFSSVPSGFFSRFGLGIGPGGGAT